MAKKIIAFVVIVLVLAAAFFASYRLSDKYWDKLAPMLGMEETTAKAPDAVPVIATPTEAPTTVPATTEEEITFPSFLSSATVEMPTDETWKLILLNRNYKVAESYVPELAPALDGSAIQLDARVAAEFKKMYDAAKEDGVELTPVAGYVSTEIQQALFDQKVEELVAGGAADGSAMFLASETVLPGGCSEDNIGISVSIGMQVDSFAQSDAYRWLKDNAAKYGFIERYTAEKKAFTQVTARPWYWRYVGSEAAEAMKQTGACLEEYLQQ
ncbi:MAG: M15 family metallopeptidase [Clostridia bacterium]|nr:M15 family metallopeptidase [Clostridia bacterium]